MRLPLAFIIEDDEVIAEVLKIALREAKYRPIYISDGKTALDQLNATVPALVVLDLHLPRMPGITVLRSIRKDDRLKETRVMVITADTLMAESLRGEADVVLVKPFGFNQLREQARRLRPDYDSSRHWFGRAG